jgi:hypothetical protein
MIGKVIKSEEITAKYAIQKQARIPPVSKQK